mmetsp:Transcript_12659/g.21560  ORF Transcript_12659/g.21560 Transcript_12659/m.21560 type:complete len:227 (-) Transcript_12659:58-738(-)
MLHCTANNWIKRDALLHERSDVCALGIANTVNFQLIEGKEGDTTKLFFLQAFHDPCRSIICIYNDVEQRVLRCNLHGSLVLLISKVEILNHQSEILHPHGEFLGNNNVFQSIKARRSCKGHRSLHIVKSSTRSLFCLSDFIGEFTNRTPLLFPRVSHFITKTLLLIHTSLQFIQHFCLLLKIFALLLNILGLTCHRLAQTRQLVTLTVQQLLLLGLRSLELLDLSL